MSILEWPTWKVNKMDGLYRKRQSDYFKQIFKYLRYVLNDFFVLSVLFALGGLGLAYSDYVKSLSHPSNLWYSKPLLVLIAIFLLQIGKPKTLLKKADAVFLLAKESEMGQYLKRSFFSSYLSGAAIVFVGGLVLVPFMLFACDVPKSDVCLIIFLMLASKTFVLLAEFAEFYDEKFSSLLFELIFRVLLPVLALLLALFLNAVLSLCLMLGAIFFLIQNIRQSAYQKMFRWNFAIEKETARMMELYRFFNLFCDVPYVVAKAKRRRFLDAFLPKPNLENPYRYLYVRCLARSGEYSSLLIRLLVLGSVILAFLDTYLSLLIAAVFLYMLGFQLIPLATNYDEIVFMHIYPQGFEKKINDFRGVLRTVMLVAAFIFAIFCLIGTGQPLMALEALAIMLVETFFVTGNYLEKKLSINLTYRN